MNVHGTVGAKLTASRRGVWNDGDALPNWTGWVDLLGKLAELDVFTNLTEIACRGYSSIYAATSPDTSLASNASAPGKKKHEEHEQQDAAATTETPVSITVIASAAAKYQEQENQQYEHVLFLLSWSDVHVQRRCLSMLSVNKKKPAIGALAGKSRILASERAHLATVSSEVAWFGLDFAPCDYRVQFSQAPGLCLQVEE